MEPEFPIDEELIALASTLRTLRPTDSRFDRDALLYGAGRAAAQVQSTARMNLRPRRSTHWIWPLTTAVSLCVAFSAVAWRSGSHTAATADAPDRFTAPRIEYQQRPVNVAAAVPLAERPAPTYLLELEQAVNGRFDEIGSATSGRTPERPPLSRDRLLEELLEETLL